MNPHTSLDAMAKKMDGSKSNEASSVMEAGEEEEGDPSMSGYMDEVHENRNDGRTSQHTQTFPPVLASHGRVKGPVSRVAGKKDARKRAVIDVNCFIFSKCICTA